MDREHPRTLKHRHGRGICPGPAAPQTAPTDHSPLLTLKAYVLNESSKHRFELTSRALRVCCSPMDSRVMAWYLMCGSEAPSRA